MAARIQSVLSRGLRPLFRTGTSGGGCLELAAPFAEIVADRPQEILRGIAASGRAPAGSDIR
ncbi:hypothetical protein D9M70_577870 [compost metagenome]